MGEDMNGEPTEEGNEFQLYQDEQNRSKVKLNSGKKKGKAGEKKSAKGLQGDFSDAHMAEILAYK